MFMIPIFLGGDSSNLILCLGIGTILIIGSVLLFIDPQSEQDLAKGFEHLLKRFKARPYTTALITMLVVVGIFTMGYFFQSLSPEGYVEFNWPEYLRTSMVFPFIFVLFLLAKAVVYWWDIIHTQKELMIREYD